MADNTNYIGVAMGMDVTDLKAGLSEANKQIQLANSKFQAAASEMDDWTKSSEGLTAKIEQLSTVLDMQKRKLAGLKKEHEQVAKEQGENSEAARNLQVQINRQQATVNRTEREFKNFKETLEGVENGAIDLENVTLKAGKAVEKAGKKTKEAGENAEKAGDGFTVAKGAVATFVGNALTSLVTWAKDGAAALLDLSESTREYREDMGKLKTAFESAGKSTELATETYRDFYTVLGEEDRSVEAVSHLAKFVETEQDMAKWTNIAAGVWGTFGDSLPVEGLTEASNETAKVGKVTGVLADALNWAGVNEDKFNESLEKCNTEQERAKLITDTLNGLYEKAAENYRKNNASVMKAREETADYNDTLAELGETLEPVNAEINSLKLELAKEFAPVLKKEVVPAVKDFFDKLEDTNAAEKAGKSIAFLVENLDTIARVTVTTIGVWKTFTTVMAISNTISATTKAITAYTGAINTAKKAQIAFNAAQSANLFGAIATLAATAISAIATYALTAEDAEEATDLLTGSQREAVTTAEELAEEYRETKKAAAELAGQELANLDYTENLWKELQKLADKNGVVKKGYEDRANFILTELNKALSTEYTMNGNIITQYGDMKKSIEEVILAKRAQILLTAHEESYKKAVENVAAAEKARAIQAQELAEQQEIVRQKEKEYNDYLASDDYRKLVERGTDAALTQLSNETNRRLKAWEKEKGILAEKQGKYNETESTLYQYYSDIDTYQKASTLIMQGETAKAVQYLDDLKTGFMSAEDVRKSAAYRAMKTEEEKTAHLKDTLGQQVINTEINARLMKQAYVDGVDGVTQEMVDTAEEQARKAKKEFEDVGGEITKGIAEGAEDEEWTLSSAMENLVQAGLAAAKEAAGINSPARLFRDKVGKFIGEGVGVGVLASIPEVKKDVQKFNDFLAENIGEDGVAGLSANISTHGDTIRRAAVPHTSAGGDHTASRSTVVNAGLTVNYNGKLSRKQLKKTENEHYKSVRMKLKKEGAI